MRVVAVIVLVCLLVAVRADDNNTNNKTVIGPRNINLHSGAEALQRGDGRTGVEETLRGLRLAVGDHEVKTGHANLCAGFILIDQAETALTHCNWVLERYPTHWQTYNNRALAYLHLERFDEAEADIEKGQELRPRSEKLKEIKGQYLDKVQPVVEKITIDDRRTGTDDSGNEERE